MTAITGSPMADGEAFSECEEVTDDRPIRQGDIFAWLEAPTDPWRKLGVVVTANCDIAQRKHRGILSYVPVLPLHDYFRLFYLPSRLEKGVRPVVEELTKSVREYQVTNRPDFPEPLSEAATLAWAQERNPAEIADELRITDQKARTLFTELVRDYRAIRNALDGEAYQNQLDALVRIRARQQRVPHEKAQQTILQDIHGAMETLAGDCFFIGRIAAQYTIGHVAYLRLVREIRHGQIAIKQSDLSGLPPLLARRVSRLQSPYIFRLTQQLADVFLAIGLPPEYEHHRRRLVESFTANPQHRLAAQPEQRDPNA